MLNNLRRRLSIFLYNAARSVLQSEQRSLFPGRIPLSLFNLLSKNTQSDQRHQLLPAFLQEVSSIVDCEGASVHLYQDGAFRLENWHGLDQRAVLPDTDAPSEDHPFDRACRLQRVIRHNAGHDAKSALRGHLKILVVPSLNVDGIEGVISLYFRRKTHVDIHDEYLLELGRFLALALEKMRSDAARRRSINTEQRTLFAAELHDSLAQTLASMNLQLLIVKNAIKGENKTIQQPINALSYTLDEANNEIRELIEHFRTPMDQRGLGHAITRSANRLRDSHGLHVLVQLVGDIPSLPMHVNAELARIAQESLTNIAKHAKASSVRIRLGVDDDQALKLLIEDDGVGFGELDQSQNAQNEGYHVGLKIMHERAERIGATLSIESETNEGTSIYCSLDLLELESRKRHENTYH